MSPLLYIVVSQGLIYFIFGWVMLHIWQKCDQQRHILFWGTGFVFGALGWLVNLIPISLFSSEALFWLMDTMVTMISVSCVVYGFVVRAERSVHMIWFVIAAFVALNFMVYFSSIFSSNGLRMAISPIFVSLCLQLGVIVLLRRKGGMSASDKAMALIMQFSVLIHASRAYITIQQHLTQSTDLKQYLDFISFMFLPVDYTAIGIGILMIVASDLARRNSELSITDPLTGTLNLNGIEQTAEKLMAHCQRSEQWISLILTNIDNLHSINEQYGHHVGDMVLRTFANTLATNLRTGDYIGRIGGEEFILLMPNTSDDGALHMAERLRLSTGQICLTDRGQEIRFTASFGVVSSRHEYHYNKLLSRAEHALYQANLSGRNRVVTPDQY